MSQQPLPPDFMPWDAEQPELQKPRRRLKPGAKTALLTLVLLCAVLVILREGVFKIRHIAVVGNDTISFQEVVSAAGLDSNASFFSLNEEKIRAGIDQNRYLVFEKMEKEFPSGVTIYVRERKPCANVQVMGITYLLDAEANDADAANPMPAYAYKAQCNAILAFDESANLGKIQAPVLVVAGDHDLLATVPLVMEMVNAIPNCRLHMVKDGGHVQHWEDLEGYNKVTLNFLLEQAK